MCEGGLTVILFCSKLLLLRLHVHRALQLSLTEYVSTSGVRHKTERCSCFGQAFVLFHVFELTQGQVHEVMLLYRELGKQKPQF